MMSLKQLTIACPAKLVIFPSFSSLGNLEYASIDLANDGSYQGSSDLDGQLLLSLQFKLFWNRDLASSAPPFVAIPFYQLGTV